MLRERPDQILKIFIRNVTGERSDGPRFEAVFSDIDPARWQLFEEPQSLSLH